MTEQALKRENEIKDLLERKFAGRVSDVRVARERRLFAKTAGADAHEVIAWLRSELGFVHLSTITGLDEGENFAALYHLVSGPVVLSLKAFVPAQSPVLPTVTDIFPGAEDFERELADLLGFTIEGLREGRRYPLPDEWPAGQYPLRKSWKGLPAETGEGK